MADVIDCSESKIYKIESGDVGLGRSDLLVMLDRYGVKVEQARATLLDLQKRGKERGWWARFGQLPDPTVVRNFALAVIPGLLQAEDYARAIISAHCSQDGADEIERRVKVRMARRRTTGRSVKPRR